MTRPRIPDEKRQRTAHACNPCKHRKQKCNGSRPCNPCIKRDSVCKYSPQPFSSGNEPFSPSTSTTERQHSAPGSQPPSTLDNSWSSMGTPDAFPPRVDHDTPDAVSRDSEGTPANRVSLHSPDGTVAREEEEHVKIYEQVRMLQDPNSRLLFIGYPSTPSFLQLMRLVIEDAVGPSQFTRDSARYMMTEPRPTLPQGTTFPQPIPERDVTDTIVHSYYTNTHGLIEVLDRQRLQTCLDALYTCPDSVHFPDLCLIYLTLAIGYATKVSFSNVEEKETTDLSSTKDTDQAEMFFRRAKYLGDPASGFEDGDLWSIQALCLMCVYEMMVSRWNAAYSHIGMAVRSAFSLGLHRLRDTMVIFDDDHVALRENIWRSLFILDRLISSSLGRPAAISEENSPQKALQFPTKEDTGSNRLETHIEALSAIVETCQFVGLVSQRIYTSKEVSTKTGQELLDESASRANRLNPKLDLNRLLHEPLKMGEAIAILHLDLLETHSVILLTRPFFLYLFIKTQEGGLCITTGPQRKSTLERLSKTCLSASLRVIALVHTVYQMNCLPPPNSFFLQFLFSATLVILCNRFASLHANDRYASSLGNSVRIFEYSASSNSHTEHLLSILMSFREIAEDSKHPRPLKRTRVPTRSVTATPSPGPSSFGKDEGSTPPAGLGRGSSAFREAPQDSKASIVRLLT